MPLPSVIHGAKQCTVKCKRTGIRCKNPVAFGCKSCRIHGAHKSRNVLRGKDHPHYLNGNRTKEAEAENSAALTRLGMLEQIGWHLNMFSGKKTRGRKPNGYLELDLNDPEQLALAIKISAKK